MTILNTMSEDKKPDKLSSGWSSPLTMISNSADTLDSGVAFTPYLKTTFPPASEYNFCVALYSYNQLLRAFKRDALYHSSADSSSAPTKLRGILLEAYDFIPPLNIQYVVAFWVQQLHVPFWIFDKSSVMAINRLGAGPIFADLNQKSTHTGSAFTFGLAYCMLSLVNKSKKNEFTILSSFEASDIGTYAQAVLSLDLTYSRGPAPKQDIILNIQDFN